VNTEACHIFDRGGLASLSDLRTPEYGVLFSHLEKEQAEFLVHEQDFRSPEYRWPKDPLHEWSRIWEYPYAYHHLRRWRQTMPSGATPTVADVGSGVTFFPFSIARLGCNVICTDIDPVCETDLGRAATMHPVAPGAVQFRRSGENDLPFVDGELDAVYSISVVEHIPAFAHTLDEVWRVLKPGGLFLLTCDICLQGAGELRVESYRRLTQVLRSRFETVFPDIGIHPLDTLCSDSLPQPKKATVRRTTRKGLLSAAWGHRMAILESPRESLASGVGMFVKHQQKQPLRLAVMGSILRKQPCRSGN
jgi:SAM-dependent methyltransferase